MFPVAELFAQKKPITVTWSVGGGLPAPGGQKVSPGVAGPVTGVCGKVMFVAGGANFPDSMPWQGGKKKYYNTIWLFTKKGNGFSALAGEFRLPQNIAYAACCSTPQGIFYAGGENETGISDRSFLLKWDSKLQSVITDTLPRLPIAVSNAFATSYNSIVFVAGGEGRDGVSDKCWSIDLNNQTSGWKELPSMPAPVSHAVFLVLPSGNGAKLLLAGGRMKTAQGTSEFYNAVSVFDIAGNQWKKLPPLPYALSAGTGITAGPSQVILFGGDRGTTFSKVENCLVAISKAANETEKEKLIQQKNQLLASHPGFSNEVLLYDLQTGKTEVIDTMPYPTPVTTTAFWWGKMIVIPSGEIKAGVRTPQLLTAKLHRP